MFWVDLNLHRTTVPWTNMGGKVVGWSNHQKRFVDKNMVPMAFHRNLRESRNVVGDVPSEECNARVKFQSHEMPKHMMSHFFEFLLNFPFFGFVSMVCTIRPLLINHSCKPHRIAAFIASLFEYFSRYIVMITVTRLHENPAVKHRRIRSNKEKKYCQFEPSSSYPYNCFLPSRGLIYLIHCSPFRPCSFLLA